MRRIILILAVSALMAAIVAINALPAAAEIYACHREYLNAYDWTKVCKYYPQVQEVQ